MELRILRYFITVAREQNISKAAEKLFITQPTLSRQIIDLESELNTKLFHRGNRNHKITLTSEGQLLLSRAKEIISLADKAEAEFLSPCDTICGDVYIGGGETEAMRIVAKTIKTLQKSYPFINFHIYSGNADEVIEKLDTGILDFGVLIEPANIEKYDYIKLPTKDIWGLLMKKNSPLATKKFITAEDLIDLPLLTSRQALVRNQICGWSKIDYEKLNIKATYNLIYNASLLVDEEIGYALCLDNLINTSGDSTLCFVPLNPTLESSLNIIWKKNQVFSKATKLFLTHLQENIR